VPALPVSGAEVALRNPDGTDDLLLAEADGNAVEIGIALLARLADGIADASLLAITDFEHLLLRSRVARLGPGMTLGLACPHCRALAELGFDARDCLASARPRTVPGVVADPERPGWFRLSGAGFRLPTAGDQARIIGRARPEQALAMLCLDETARKRPWRTRVERAMEAMAPPLSRSIGASCPSCGIGVRASFSVAHLVIDELKRAAGNVHDEIDAIARAYHWPEALILSLPQARRRAYAERIRRAERLAA
jgi:hypothetical protein